MEKISKLIKILLISSIPLFFITKKLTAPGPNQSRYLSPEPKNKTIVIDPGHDIQNQGTGLPEERILTLNIAKKLQSKWIREGYGVYLTREDENPVNKDSIDLDLDGKVDNKDELIARKNIAKEKNADYFFSLHFNANYRNKKKTGTDLFFYGLTNKWQTRDRRLNFNNPTKLKNPKYYSEKSLQLANNIADYLNKKDLKINIYGSDLEVLCENASKKTILVEFDYLTNKTIRKFANTEAGKEYYTNLLFEAFKYAESK